MFYREIRVVHVQNGDVVAVIVTVLRRYRTHLGTLPPSSSARLLLGHGSVRLRVGALLVNDTLSERPEEKERTTKLRRRRIWI